jgi:hypothetical protein
MNKTYDLFDAIRDEIAILEELEKLYETQEKGLLKLVVTGQRRSLTRILSRYEKGHEYYIGVVNGQPQLMYRQTTRHLERNFPAVARAKNNLDIVVDIVKDNANET